MSEQQQERSQESLRHEYAEVTQNVRHYSNLRFAIFTIFFAVMAGVGIVAFGEGQFDAHAAVVARIAGFAVIMIFWMYEERTSLRLKHFAKVAVELERSLGYTQFTTIPAPGRYLPDEKAVTRVFFLIITLLWLYAAFAVPLNR